MASASVALEAADGYEADVRALAAAMEAAQVGFTVVPDRGRRLERRGSATTGSSHRIEGFVFSARACLRAIEMRA